MTTNPLQGLYTPKMSRFLSSNGGLDGTHGHAYLLEAKKGIVFQERTALQVMQEAHNAGASFERDVYRYRVAGASLPPRSNPGTHTRSTRGRSKKGGQRGLPPPGHKPKRCPVRPRATH